MSLYDQFPLILGTLFPALKRRAALRARWGRPGEEKGWGASWCFDLQREHLSRAAIVDDKTWIDLEFPRFFCDIDTTVTPVGRQRLFALLRTFEYGSAELESRYRTGESLKTQAHLRERIQLALRPLETDSAAFIADLLRGPEPKQVPHGRLLLPWSAVSLVAIIAGIVGMIPIWFGALPLAINLVIAGIVDAKLARNVDGLMGLARMLSVARRLISIREGDFIAPLRQLKSEAAKRKRLETQIKWLAALDRIRSHDIVGGIAVMANALLLLKFALYSRAIDKFASGRDEWLSTYDLIGEVDASISIANFLVRYPNHCRPESSDGLLAIEKGYHPFISDPVTNSIALDEGSALVTGSNMTGKTTFIKMIAINAILGHTLGVCLAHTATLPRSPVRALIRGDQSVAEGKSRYFAEAEAIRGFIEESKSGACRIFVLDEPFSGTNTVERIAVAKAVLHAIGEHATLFVTTHDVELQYLLGQRFRLFHFQENPAVEGFFDHRLHVGASTQRNAIRVLERLGYPAQIIAEALATVPAIERGGADSPRH